MRRTLAGILALASFTCSRPEPDDRCALTIELADAAHGHTVPGLVRAATEDGRPVPLEGLLSRGLGLAANHAAGRWAVLPGPATVRVPRAKLVIEAFRGIETEVARAEPDLTGRSEARARLLLRRFVPPHDKGWWSANTHLHLQKVSRDEALRYLSEVPRADGLDVLFVSYLERAEADREYVTNGLIEADLEALTRKTGVLFGNGEEHRHNFTAFGQGYGHVMFLNLKKLVLPVSIGPGIMKKGTDAPPLQKGIDEARSQGATAIWCHNTFGLEDIPNWVSGRPHAQNIFDGDPAAHGSFKDTFYRYLNAGLRVPFSTGTDWFIYDFSRVYARVPEGVRSARDWLAALEAGRTFITNGPLLEFEVEGAGPGETVRRDGPGRVRVRGRAQGRVDFRRLEIVRNGEVAAATESYPDGTTFSATLAAELLLEGPAWLALRVPPPPGKDEPARNHPVTELGGPLFAHTSPVYVEIAGRGVSDPGAVRGLLEEVRASKAFVEKNAHFADDHERGHVLSVYAAALATLEKLMPR
jgi:hypothetical protein